MSNTNENIQPDSDYMNKLVSRIKTAIVEKKKAKQEEAERKIKQDEDDFNNELLPYLEDAFIELASPFIKFPRTISSYDVSTEVCDSIVYHAERLQKKGFIVDIQEDDVIIGIPMNNYIKSK